MTALSRPPVTARSRPPVRWSVFAVATPLVVAALVAALAKSSGHHDPKVMLAAAALGVLVVALIAVVPPSWSLSAALVLSMFGGSWQQLGLPNSVAPDRLVLGFTLLAIAVRAPGSRDRPMIRFRPLYAVMYVAGAYAIASAMAAGTITQHFAIFGLLDRMQIIDWLVLIIAPCAFSTAADRRVLLGTMVGMGIYLGLTGIFEIIGPQSLVFPRYIQDPLVGVQFGRARGPFVEATINGIALYACLLASLIAWRQWRSPLARRLAMLSIAVCAVSLLLTLSRSVWIGVGVSLLVMLILVRQLRPQLVRVIVVLGLIVGLSFVLVPGIQEHASSRANDSQTVRDREALDTAALNMIVHRPLFGVGWGRFIPVSQNYYETSDSYALWNLNPLPVHDVYLGIATELGLVGLALWLGVLLFGVGGAVLGRNEPELLPWRLALGALLVMWLTAGVSSVLGGTFPSLIIFFLAAVVVGGRRESPLPRAVKPSPRLVDPSPREIEPQPIATA